MSRSERRTKEVLKGPLSVCFYRFESKVLFSVCFYRFWRRLFRKEVGDDDHGVAGRGPDVQDTDFAPGLVACWMRICQKSNSTLSWWLYSCAWGNVQQKSLHTYVDSITLTYFDTDFIHGVATGVVAGRMRICQKRKELLNWIFSLLRISQKNNCCLEWL